MKVCCDWCTNFVEVKDTYNPLINAVFCSPGCRDADTIFRVWQSDEAINRDIHYHMLTRGDDDE